MKVSFKSFHTHHTGVGFKNSPPFPQTHGPAHLPRVVLWHFDHLQDQTACSVYSSVAQPNKGGAEKERNLTTGYLDSGLNSVELASKNQKRATDQHRVSPDARPRLKSDRREEPHPSSQLVWSLTFPSQDIAGELAHCQLHSQTHSCTERDGQDSCIMSSVPRTQNQRLNCTNHLHNTLLYLHIIRQSIAFRSLNMLRSFAHFYQLLKSLHVDLNYRINS